MEPIFKFKGNNTLIGKECFNRSCKTARPPQEVIVIFVAEQVFFFLSQPPFHLVAHLVVEVLPCRLEQTKRASATCGLRYAFFMFYHNWIMIIVDALLRTLYLIILPVFYLRKLCMWMMSITLSKQMQSDFSQRPEKVQNLICCCMSKYIPAQYLCPSSQSAETMSVHGC